VPSGASYRAASTKVATSSVCDAASGTTSGTRPEARGKTGALWSPDAEAYLCDKHALSGADMTLLFEPNESQETTIRVIAAVTVEERTTPIKQP
jgi:hypothetical protein